LLLVCGATASADGLLEAMIYIALGEGRTIEGRLRLEAGDLLSSLGGTPESMQAMAILNDLLSNGLLHVRYTRVGEQDVVGIALELREETAVSVEARIAEDGIALNTSLLPGKTLVFPAELFEEAVSILLPPILDEVYLEALAGAVERYSALMNSWMAQTEGVLSVTGEQTPATQMRDAITDVITARVTHTQWQALLRFLAEEFIQDKAFQQVLTSRADGMDPEMMITVVQEMIDTMDAPNDAAVEVTLSFGEDDQIAGLDVRIEPPVSSPAGASAQLQGSFEYSHRAIDSERAADSFLASFTWGVDSELRAQFYRRDRLPNTALAHEGMEYGGHASFRTPYTGALDLDVLGDIRYTVEPMMETFEHSLLLRLSEKNDDPDLGDMALLLQAPLLDAGFTLNTQTQAIELADFYHAGAFVLKLMEIEVGLEYMLESSAYMPEEQPNQTVIWLDELSREELSELMQELQMNTMMLLLQFGGG